MLQMVHLSVVKFTGDNEKNIDLFPDTKISEGLKKIRSNQIPLRAPSTKNLVGLPSTTFEEVWVDGFPFLISIYPYG